MSAEQHRNGAEAEGAQPRVLLGCRQGWAARGNATGLQQCQRAVSGRGLNAK